MAEAVALDHRTQGGGTPGGTSLDVTRAEQAASTGLPTIAGPQHVLHLNDEDTADGLDDDALDFT